MNENGKLDAKLAELILDQILSKIDGGNETIMTDSFTRFINVFPEHRKIAEKIFARENARPFRTDEERTSKRGY